MSHPVIGSSRELLDTARDHIESHLTIAPYTCSPRLFPFRRPRPGELTLTVWICSLACTVLP